MPRAKSGARHYRGDPDPGSRIPDAGPGSPIPSPRPPLLELTGYGSMAGVHRPQPGVRARGVRALPPRPRVGRSRNAGAVRDLDASGRRRAGWVRAGAGRAAAPEIVAAVNLAESIRRYGHLAATLDPLGGQPPGDPSLQLRNPRPHRSGPARPAGEPRLRRPGQSGDHRVRCDRGAAAHLLFDLRLRLRPRVRAGRARVAAPGCGGGDVFARRRIPSIPGPCSIGCRRSRRSSGSCTARFPARPASRSRASTCSSRCWTR